MCFFAVNGFYQNLPLGPWTSESLKNTWCLTNIGLQAQCFGVPFIWIDCCWGLVAPSCSIFLFLSLSHSLILSFSQSLTLSFSHSLIFSLSLSPSPSLSGPFVSIHFRAYAYVSSKQEKHACVIIIVHACVYHMCMCVWCTVHCAQCVMSNVQRVYNVQCNLCIIWCSVLYCHVMQRNATQ